MFADVVKLRCYFPSPNGKFQNINSRNCTLRTTGTTMDDKAKEFLANVEGGIVPVTCHDDVLRIAYVYIDEGLWDGQGVFDVVEKLHAHGWSFGENELRFNR